MGLMITLVETSKDYDPVLMIIGIALLAIRAICMRAFKLTPKTASYLLNGEEYDPKFNGWFNPIIFHVSFYISIFFSLSLIFSFRVKVFNAISVVFFPSLLFSVPGRDIQVLFHTDKFGAKKFSLFWWNSLTIHIPMLIIGIYMLIFRAYYITQFSFWVAFIIVLFFFLSLDNKDNGVVNGKKYIELGLIVMVIWTIICEIFVFPSIPSNVDSLIAPVFIFQ
ncbi:MAG: hypothetical protein ACTSU2_12865 [Promethearchaeota archaeon]